jgi:transcriptional regulator with XRE-family HTH domain
MDDLRLKFGENLRLQRKRMGLTQERLAELSKLDRTEISLLERGKRMPQLDTIVGLTRGLGLHSPGELLGGMV